jgi:hypothetical protein
MLRDDIDTITIRLHLPRETATCSSILPSRFWHEPLVFQPIAAGVVYPVFGILLSPILAAAAMALSSVSVIGNALGSRAAKL